MTISNSTSNPTPGTPSWKDQKVKLQAKFSNLTDADLNYEDGKKDEMFTKIQTKLGKTKEEFATIIAAL